MALKEFLQVCFNSKHWSGWVNMHNIYWQMRYDGSFVCSIGRHCHILISSPNELERCSVYRELKGSLEWITMAENIPVQEAFDRCSVFLNRFFRDTRKLWDKEMTDRWGVQPASDKQKTWVKELLQAPENREKYGDPHFEIDELTKYQASILIDRLFDPRSRN